MNPEIMAGPPPFTNAVTKNLDRLSISISINVKLVPRSSYGMADSQVHIIAVVKAIKDNRPNRLCVQSQSLIFMIEVDDVCLMHTFSCWSTPSL